VTAALVRDRYHRLHAAENPFAFFNTLGRIPYSHVPSTTRASLTMATCSKTRPEIIVSIVGSADGFRDTDRGRHPAGQAFRFL
jgi:hypothetical protein